MDDEQNFRIRRSQPEMLPQLYEMLPLVAVAEMESAVISVIKQEVECKFSFIRCIQTDSLL